MNGARSSTVRYRVPDAVPLLRGGRAGGAIACVERPLPVASSILWTPARAQLPADVAYPIFIAQRALAAVHDHLAGTARGASALGFLAGRVCRCPDTGTQYIIVESTIPLPWSISGDHLKPALLQGWTVARDDVRKTGDQLLGWYRSHFAADVRLSPTDVDTHLSCFDQPWHVALVVTPGEEPAGGVLRISPDAPWSNEQLPFYELVDDTAVLPDGRKVTDLAWVNYRTDDAILCSDRGSRPDLELGSRLLFPEEFAEEALAAPLRRLFPVERIARLAGYGVVGILAAGVLLGVYRALASGPSNGAAAVVRQVTVAAIPDRVDGLADTVALAVGAFDLRARLFEDHQMACPDLARGLVDLEERWTAYNAARKGVAAASLDSTRNARDRALYSDVDAAERRFERSQCPRP